MADSAHKKMDEVMSDITKAGAQLVFILAAMNLNLITKEHIDGINADPTLYVDALVPMLKATGYPKSTLSLFFERIQQRAAELNVPFDIPASVPPYVPERATTTVQKDGLEQKGRTNGPSKDGPSLDM